MQIRAEVITKLDRVKRIIDLLAAKYGEMSQIEKYYSKMDVAVEVSLDLLLHICVLTLFYRGSS